MKVLINYTVDVDDDVRREINQWYGRPGLATRSQVKAWYESNGLSMDDDLADMAARRDGDGLLESDGSNDDDD
jgi:hypothetical protein